MASPFTVLNIVNVFCFFRRGGEGEDKRSAGREVESNDRERKETEGRGKVVNGRENKNREEKERREGKR